MFRLFRVFFDEKVLVMASKYSSIKAHTCSLMCLFALILLNKVVLTYRILSPFSRQQVVHTYPSHSSRMR
jgi:competence protein ComGF